VTTRSRAFALIACLMAAGTTLSAASATDPKAAKEAQEAVRDYVHYVRIARYDLAQTYAQSVLDKMAFPFGLAEGDAAIDPAELVKLIEDSGEGARFDDAVARGGRIDSIEKVSSALGRAHELGKRSVARNTTQIDANIALLTGTQRQRLLGRERLAAAGEYAMPQLITALSAKTDNPGQRAEVRSLMVDMGRMAARPLSAALTGLDASTQELAANVLGDIGASSSVAYLYELHNASSVPSVKAAAARAITKITGNQPDPSAANVARSFRVLAEQYLAGAEALTPYAKESVQPAWSFDPASGLSGRPISSKVFHETMAMQVAEHALRASPSDREALATWITANFKREIETPTGYNNPLYEGRAEAMYYASAAGSSVLQSVLARALSAKDPQLAQKAIAAIARTNGPAAFAKQGGTGPLTAALRFPSRRVQTDAALALAGGALGQSFDGSERVVPVLAAAVGEAGVRSALVIASDADRGSALAGQLRDMGYAVLAPATDAASIESSIAGASSVELVAVAQSSGKAAETLTLVRSHPKLGASPVVAFGDAAGLAELGRAWERDEMVSLVRSGVDAKSLQNAVEQVSVAALGEPLSEAEASEYKSRALGALREVAMAGSAGMNITDAAAPLVAALGPAKGPARGQIAGVLGQINDQRAQRALVDTALKAEGDDMTGLLAAATESAKRFGNLLDDRQVKQLTTIAAKPGNPGATSVSVLLGALNVASERVVPLIIGD